MAFDLGLVEDAYTAALSNPQHDTAEDKVRRLVLALVEQGEQGLRLASAVTAPQLLADTLSSSILPPCSGSVQCFVVGTWLGCTGFMMCCGRWVC